MSETSTSLDTIIGSLKGSSYREYCNMLCHWGATSILCGQSPSQPAVIIEGVKIHILLFSLQVSSKVILEVFFRLTPFQYSQASKPNQPNPHEAHLTWHNSAYNFFSCGAILAVSVLMQQKACGRQLKRVLRRWAFGCMGDITTKKVAQCKITLSAGCLYTNHGLPHECKDFRLCWRFRGRAFKKTEKQSFSVIFSFSIFPAFFQSCLKTTFTPIYVTRCKVRQLFGVQETSESSLLLWNFFRLIEFVSCQLVAKACMIALQDCSAGLVARFDLGMNKSDVQILDCKTPHHRGPIATLLVQHVFEKCSAMPLTTSIPPVCKHTALLESERFTERWDIPAASLGPPWSTCKQVLLRALGLSFVRMASAVLTPEQWSYCQQTAKY